MQGKEKHPRLGLDDTIFSFESSVSSVLDLTSTFVFSFTACEAEAVIEDVTTAIESR